MRTAVAATVAGIVTIALWGVVVLGAFLRPDPLAMALGISIALNVALVVGIVVDRKTRSVE